MSLLPTTNTNTNTNTKANSRKPKYPVQRGEEIDSRKIVSNSRQHLTAIRLNHILFASEELATQTLYGLKTATLAFDELALQVSNCALTRNEKGAIGWVNTNEINNVDDDVDGDGDGDGDDESNDDTTGTGSNHLDLILPPDARKKILHMNTKVSHYLTGIAEPYVLYIEKQECNWQFIVFRDYTKNNAHDTSPSPTLYTSHPYDQPGDIVMVESVRGIHLVQIADVMVDVRKMAATRPRNKIGIAGQGILGGALLLPLQQQNMSSEDATSTSSSSSTTMTTRPDLTYVIETMGCQMNQADSERMEGQLQALSIRPLGPDEETRLRKKPDFIGYYCEQ